MFKTTIFATAALATAIAATPISTANAGDIDFGFTITGPNGGSISFGTGGGYGGGYDYDMSCWEARDYLKGEFKKVQKIECNGDVYTFKVRKFNFSPWKTLKINSENGAYWFV
jgi:hypothetical protein